MHINSWASVLSYRYPRLYGACLGGKRRYEVAHWLGFRVLDFNAEFEVREKKFRGLDYRLLLDNNSYEYPGAITIKAATVYGFGYPDGQFSSEDESPEYSVRRYFKWPELDLSILFTPRAPAALVRHAFQPHLNCVWSFRGCRTTKQILPLALADEESIQHATDVRLHSANPCPDRILPRRARDISDILLVKVKSVGAELVDDVDPINGRYRPVSYDLLRIFKGKAGIPLEHVLYPWPEKPNRATQLLYPGSRLLMFSEVYTCEMVPATDSAMQTIQSALAQARLDPPN